jgi:xylulokinase
MDPQARGLLLGLSSSQGRPEIVRAVMEGVAMACYDAFGAMREAGARPSRIVMAGGGARSFLWRTIIADVFGMPVEALETAEQSALGAALLAGEGLGWWDAAAKAVEWTRSGPPVEPDSGRHALYQERLEIFRAAYLKHREDFARLSPAAGSNESRLSDQDPGEPAPGSSP